MSATSEPIPLHAERAAEAGDGDDDAPVSRTGPQPDSTWVVLGTLTVCLPLAVAIVVLAGRAWFPVLDLAMTEIRVRDVGTRRTPLIGLPGRIGEFPDQGSHPGPLSFWLWAGPYRLLGSSAWALQVAAGFVNLVAVLTALVIGARRGGRSGVAVVAAAIAVMIRGFGVELFVEPWNPYAPLLWWFVVLLAAWSVLCGDHRVLVVLVAAATFCTQTHVPYAVLCIPIVLAAFAAVALNMWRLGTVARGPLISSLGFAGIAGGVLWLAPLIDQIRRSPGNLRMLFDHFSTPGEPPIGLRAGFELTLRHLDPFDGFLRMLSEPGAFVLASSDPERRVWAGALLLVLWLASIALAAVVRHRTLVRLHAVVAVALVLGLIAMSRIFGKVWFYLTLWSWVTTTLLMVALIWTLVTVARIWLPSNIGRAVRLGFEAVAVVLVVGAVVGSVIEAADAEPPEAHLSDTLGEVLLPTLQVLEREPGGEAPPATVPDRLDELAPGPFDDDDEPPPAAEQPPVDDAAEQLGAGFVTGRDATYLVTWTDAYFFGSQGYGLVNELERNGFEVGVLEAWRVPVTPYRVLTPDEATTGVHLATGIRIPEWRERADTVEIAFVEPRSPAELVEYEELRSTAIAELRADGLDELVELVDSNLFLVSNDQRISRPAAEAMARMLILGQETAVFLVPPGSAP